MLSIAETDNTMIQTRFNTMVRGEQYKMLHNRWLVGSLISLYVVFILFTGLNILPLAAENAAIQSLPSMINLPYQLMTTLATNLRGWSGIFIMILTAISIGVEYQHGTIRVLLGRGLGRMRLLSAKLTAIMIMGLGITLILLLTTLAEVLVTSLFVPQFFQTIPDYLWSDAAVNLVTILVSVLVTMVLTTLITLFVRSLGIGLAIALAWFPVEGIVKGILFVIASATQNQTWYEVSKYFLSTSIERLPVTLLPERTTVQTIGNAPIFLQYISTTAMEPVLALAIYVLLLGGLSYFLIRWRDVMN